MLCRRARVDPSLLAHPHERLPGSSAARLWDAAIALTGDPLLGLHLTEHYRTGALSILGYVILNCRTGLEVLERLARFAALLNDGIHVRTSVDGPLVVVHFETSGTVGDALADDDRQEMETMAAGVVLTLRRVVDRPFVPAQVWFRHAAQGPVAEYHRIFGAPVRFGQAEHRVALPHADLAVPIPTADPTLLQLFETHAAERLGTLTQRGETTQRVLRLLVSGLTGTAPDLERVARALATSARQLQRTLHDEGTSFQALLDEVRRDTALARLRTPGATASEVALLLGFSEASAFTRAFRRWTGTTPSAWALSAPARP